MPSTRPRLLLAATLLAAGALLAVAAAGPAGAVPTSTSTLPSPTPSSPTPTPWDPAPTPSGSAQPPTGPGDLRAAAVTTTSVTLAWSAATPGANPIAGYDITYNEAFNDIFWLQSLGDVTTVVITTGIHATGQYTFRITARDTAGNRSITGSSVGVVTPASDTAADRTPPSAPTNLQVTGNGPAGATLAWSPSTDDVAVTGYNVYRFDGLFVSTLVTTVPGTTATVPGTTEIQSLYVRARDAAGNLSAASNFVSAPVTTTPPTTPPAPTCSVTYRTSSQWAGGFVADLKITNAGPAAVANWVLTFRFGGDQTVSSSWGATFTQSGAEVTLTGAHWNRTIPAGGSVSAGLLGRWSASAAPPATAALNGAACTVA